MNMCIFIADDDVNIINQIKTISNKWAWKTNDIEIEFCESTNISMRDIEDASKADVVFLDIEIPKINGIDFARLVRANNINATIVLMTNYQKYAVNGYDVHPISFLVKPLQEKYLIKIFEMAKSRIGNPLIKKVLFRNQGKTELHLIDDVIYVEAQGHKCCVSLVTEDVTYRLPFSELHETLPYPPFIRCHRGYYINVNHIRRWHKKEVQMSNDSIIPVSAKYQGVVKNCILKIGED